MKEEKEIKKIYVLLCGMCKAIREAEYRGVNKSSIDRYNQLIEKLKGMTLDEYFCLYNIDYNECTKYDDGDIKCSRDIFLIKLLPMIEYLEKIYIDTTDETIKKIGSLYNSITDMELQRRCGDILLEASDAFDRVINQATQILEDRIKKKAGLEQTALIGLPLVSRAIHSKLENTILKFSDTPEIQEQYSALFKGIIGVYRNSTHHGLEYKCTREEALKFCAYIDLLLNEVENSEKII